MTLTRKTIGYNNFGKGIVDITDPCYDRDIWCRLNGVAIRPGVYECVAWTCEEGGGDDPWDVGRVWVAAIYFRDTDEETYTETIGTIGVDAGLAGFFEDKPDYNDEEWRMFCSLIEEGNAWINDCGFFTSSGLGDGGYRVKALKSREKNDIIGLEIEF